MILPQSYWQCLILVIFGIICWVSWVNLFDRSKWRYELFYVDVAVGILIAAIVVAFTLGNLGYDGFSLLDDLSHAWKRKWLLAIGGGALLNLGTMLIFAARSTAGISVAFPIGIGLGLAVGVFLPQVITGTGNRSMLLAGIICSVGAMLLAGIAYASRLAERYAATPKDPKKKTRPPSAFKAVVLSIAGGLAMSLAFPLFEKSHAGEVGLGPYAIGLLMAVGALGCTGIVSLFLMNLPVEGEPVEIVEYFHGKLVYHATGWLAGMIWGVGTIGVLVANTASRESNLRLPTGFSYFQAVPFLAGLIGLAAWKEFAGSRATSKILMAIALSGAAAVLLALGSGPPTP
jgi:glucose uptake protein